MSRTLVGILTIAALLAGCGGSDELSAADLGEGRAFWLELDAAEKEGLARTCRAEAAQSVSESAGGSAQVRQSIESVDLDALIGRIDQWYAEDRPNPGTIADVCFAEAQDIAVTTIQSEIEELQEAPLSKLRSLPVRA